MKKFAQLTPYQFASNSPIVAIDLDGLEDVDYRFVMNLLFRAETQIKVTYVDYVVRESRGSGTTESKSAVDVWKTYIKVTVNGFSFPDILERSGPVKFNGDGVPDPQPGESFHNSTPLSGGSNTKVDDFTVVSEDEHVLGFQKGNVAIGILPTQETVNAAKKGKNKPNDFVMFTGYTGDGGYLRSEKKNHGGSEWSLHVNAQLHYTGGANAGGDATDPTQGTTVLIQQVVGAKPTYTQAESDFWKVYYSVVIKYVNRDKSAACEGTKPDIPANINVQSGGKTRFEYNYGSKDKNPTTFTPIKN